MRHLGSRNVRQLKGAFILYPRGNLRALLRFSSSTFGKAWSRWLSFSTRSSRLENTCKRRLVQKK